VDEVKTFSRQIVFQYTRLMEANVFQPVIQVRRPGLCRGQATLLLIQANDLPRWSYPNAQQVHDTASAAAQLGTAPACLNTNTIQHDRCLGRQSFGLGAQAAILPRAAVQDVLGLRHGGTSRGE